KIPRSMKRPATHIGPFPASGHAASSQPVQQHYISRPIAASSQPIVLIVPGKNPAGKATYEQRFASDAVSGSPTAAAVMVPRFELAKSSRWRDFLSSFVQLRPH